MSENKKLAVGCLTVIILAIIMPVITFASGWFGGWILMKIVGTAVVNGLNTLFGTTRFTPDLIPVVCGALSVIGSYFKSTSTNSK